jgi:hypothetical protein
MFCDKFSLIKDWVDDCCPLCTIERNFEDPERLKKRIGELEAEVVSLKDEIQNLKYEIIEAAELHEV